MHRDMFFTVDQTLIAGQDKIKKLLYLIRINGRLSHAGYASDVIRRLKLVADVLVVAFPANKNMLQVEKRFEANS